MTEAEMLVRLEGLTPGRYLTLVFRQDAPIGGVGDMLTALMLGPNPYLRASGDGFVRFRDAYCAMNWALVGQSRAFLFTVGAGTTPQLLALRLAPFVEALSVL